MYIISSGNIAPGVTYQVLVDSITYNGTTYSAGSYFVGVDGVTDYTGSGEVYEASLVNNISVGFEVPALFYSPNDLFTDESEINNVGAGGDDFIHYPDYTSIEELPQPGNVYNKVGTKIKVPYNVPEITDYAPSLYEGVTYAELEQLETDVSEVSLIRDSQSRIIGIQINEIQIDVVI